MEKYLIFSTFYHFNVTQDFPHFYFMLGGNLGRSLLYEDVSVMRVTTTLRSTTPQILTRTKIMSSKPNLKITKSTNRQDNKRTYRKLREQLFFLKRWPLSYPHRIQHNLHTHKKDRTETDIRTSNRTNHSRTGRGSSVGSVSATYASGPEINPSFVDIIPLFRCFKRSKVSVNGSKRMGTKHW